MFIDIPEIVSRSPETTFFEFVGRRGCGKTYGIKRFCLENYIETGKKFLYVRRKKVKAFILNTLFDDLDDPSLWERLAEKIGAEGAMIKAVAGSFWLCDQDGKRKEIIGSYAFVTQAGDFKGFPHSDCSVIFFDEVITDEGYFHGDSEPEFFNKILYTVARKGNSELRVFLAGNPDSNIELCPYFTNLKINYESLTGNEILYFNSEFHGKKLKNNIMFMKVVGGLSDDEFLNVHVAGVFGDVEATMSFSGEMARNEFKKILPGEIAKDKVLAELEIETPIMTESGYQKRIYAYFVQAETFPYMVILSHEKFKVEKIICRYDRKVINLNDNNISYRLYLTFFPKVKKVLNQCIESERIYTDSDYTAQTFFNILKSGKAVRL